MKSLKSVSLPLLIVILLGAMGFSYAWWTETLTINPGTVNTGELKVIWSDMFGEYPLPKYAGVGVAQVYNKHGNWAPPGTTQYLPLSESTFTFKFRNTFPGFYYIVYWLECKNVGTIPAKIQSITLTDIDDPGGIIGYVEWKQGSIIIQYHDGTKWVDRWTTTGFDWTKLEDVPGAYYGKLKDQVLYPGERLRFSLHDEEPEGESEESFTIRLSSALDKAEGSAFSYDMLFTWIQFNAP